MLWSSLGEPRTKRCGLVLRYAISERLQCCDKYCSEGSILVPQRAMIDTSSGRKSGKYTRYRKGSAMECAGRLTRKLEYELETPDVGSLAGSLLCLL